MWYTSFRLPSTWIVIVLVDDVEKRDLPQKHLRLPQLLLKKGTDDFHA